MSSSRRVRKLPRRVTMMDIAKEASVSQSTVSFVLNDVREAHISEVTRQRVLQAVKALGYRRRGQSFHAAAHRPIGFLIDGITTSPFGVASMDAARDLAWEHDRTLLIASSGGDAKLERASLEQLMALRPEGVIYASILTRQVDPPEGLQSLPAVLLNCYAGDERLPSVVPAEVAGGRTATTRLIAAGHRRIGFINGEPWMDAARERLHGYRSALTAAGLPFDPALVREADWSPSHAYEQTLTLLALPDPPTGVFCASDTMAVGCYEALKESGKRIPWDVAVIGYDDQWVARHMSPPLTTVLLPHEEMGRWAIEYLMTHPSDPQKEPAPQVRLECPLVERASVQPRSA